MLLYYSKPHSSGYYVGYSCPQRSEFRVVTDCNTPEQAQEEVSRLSNLQLMKQQAIRTCALNRGFKNFSYPELNNISNIRRWDSNFQY